MRPKTARRRSVLQPSVSVRTAPDKSVQDARQKFDYACPQHRELPHVVKFSGGRSSGMLLFTLLEKGMLNAERGDVVVFNNTSAEHPATYAFVRECKSVCEQKYGIPFLWTEFQTYETASAGIYNRLPAYRLVNERPYSARENSDGYHHRGEVFEELVSWTGYLPNQFSGRICTSWMKLFVSKEFLRDWFALKDGIERLGHFGEESRIDPDDIYAAHKRNGGRTPREIFLAKKKFCLSRLLCRPARKFADFSSVADCQKIRNAELEGKSMGGRVKLSGDFGVDYCSFVGFRADEPGRLAKMRARLNEQESQMAQSEGANLDSYLAAPEGEHVYAPLMQFGKSKKDAVSFWKDKKWNLGLPSDANLSNCVYCFLKGSNALWQLARRQDSVNRNLPAGARAQKDAPSDIQWWANLEEKYGRDLVAEGRKISAKVKAAHERPVIGFFGVDGRSSYRKILELSREYKSGKRRGRRRKMYLSEFQNLPCDCTD